MITVTVKHEHDFEYMADVKLGDVTIWSGLVYGTEQPASSPARHSPTAAKRNAILIVGDKLRHLLEDT